MFLSELRRLAKHCEFGDKLSVALRDQFVCGLLVEALPQKLLAEADLTLEKAVRIAQAFESARQVTIALRGDRRRHGSTTDHETAFSMQSSSSGRSKTTQSEMTYLGHRVDHEGLKPTEDKVKAIREAPEPRHVTELKAFLGLLNYYSHFLTESVEYSTSIV